MQRGSLEEGDVTQGDSQGLGGGRPGGKGDVIVARGEDEEGFEVALVKGPLL